MTKKQRIEQLEQRVAELIQEVERLKGRVIGLEHRPYLTPYHPLPYEITFTDRTAPFTVPTVSPNGIPPATTTWAFAGPSTLE